MDILQRFGHDLDREIETTCNREQTAPVGTGTMFSPIYVAEEIAVLMRRKNDLSTTLGALQSLRRLMLQASAVI